jgi:hypothetical protein
VKQTWTSNKRILLPATGGAAGHAAPCPRAPVACWEFFSMRYRKKERSQGRARIIVSVNWPWGSQSWWAQTLNLSSIIVPFSAHLRATHIRGLTRRGSANHGKLWTAQIWRILLAFHSLHHALPCHAPPWPVGLRVQTVKLARPAQRTHYRGHGSASPRISVGWLGEEVPTLSLHPLSCHFPRISVPTHIRGNISWQMLRGAANRGTTCSKGILVLSYELNRQRNNRINGCNCRGIAVMFV